MTIFVSSDLHFFHQNIIKFCPDTRGQWETVEEMNEGLIEYHNKTVKPNDTFYHLGDFSFGDSQKTKNVLSRMNGHKRFIKGNHDYWDSDKSAVDMLLSYNTYGEVKYQKQTFCLFHYPIWSWNKKRYGSIHLHGHLHQHVTDIMGRIVNVCYDNNGRYLTFDEIFDNMKSIPIVESNHHLTH